jgi:hypothetical protein
LNLALYVEFHWHTNVEAVADLEAKELVKKKQATMEKHMNLLKYLLPCALAAVGYAASMQAADFSTTTEARESDVKALADFVKSKGAITIQEKGGNLMLSGDVRAEYEHMKSKTHDKDLRGSGTGCREADLPPFATNEFDVEVNLMLDYRADRSWGKIRLTFDNPAGIRATDKDFFDHRINKHDTMFGSGKLSNIALRQAYLGYNICECGTSRFDAEIGRRRLYDVFDSKVQFYNIYDGLTLKYANSFEAIMDFYAKGAVFVVDQNVNHYGWVGELGFLNLGDEGIDFKYSYINWEKDGANRFGHKHANGSKFNISQLLLAYNFSPDFIRYKTQVYGAYLFNHDAKRIHKSDDKKAREAFYVGFKVGDIKKQNDWALDINYQWVQAQAIPESDVRGIGRDNPKDISFYKNNKFGYSNYKGYSIDLLYALTDNLTFDVKFDRVHQCQKSIGGKHRAYWFEVDAIYAF